MQIKVIPVTPIEQNCRVLYLEDSKQAVVVDPGGISVIKSDCQVVDAAVIFETALLYTLVVVTK